MYVCIFLYICTSTYQQLDFHLQPSSLGPSQPHLPFSSHWLLSPVWPPHIMDTCIHMLCIYIYIYL